MKLKTNSPKKINIALFIISLLLITAIMFVYIGQKEGFHEDEIYSYGSANNKYTDIFYASGERDATNRTINEYIIEDTFGATMDNVSYYLNHFDEFNTLVNANLDAERPVWKTAQEAQDYLIVSEDESFNFISPYYHQARDVHPPIFYYLVHIVSSVFAGVFSKYIIFGINMVFFLLTCLIIRKILILHDREHLVVPVVLLYGLSMGAVSMVIFLRMYSVLTFFTVAYFYLTLKIVKDDFHISKKTAVLLILTTIAGFLTQYYFCLFVVPVFIIVCAYLLKTKKIKAAVWYTVCHIISAVAGVLLFPPSIYHIFFSYRGFGNPNQVVFWDQFESIINRVLYAFSINRFIGVGIFLVILSYIFVRIISKTDAPEKKRGMLFNIALFVVPVIVFLMITAKLSPNLDVKTMVRYITPVLPIMAICFIVFAEKVINLLGLTNLKKRTIAVYALVAVMTVSGFVTSKPSYLYSGYHKYIETAQKHKDLNYVYVYDNYFTHLNSLPEMMVYNKTLMVNFYDEKQLNVLSGNEELENNDKFVLSIKKWMINDQNPDEVLNRVLELTGYTKAEILLNEDDDTQSILYLVSK